jgi:hypothetical protein
MLIEEIASLVILIDMWDTEKKETVHRQLRLFEGGGYQAPRVLSSRAPLAKHPNPPKMTKNAILL